MKRFYTFLSSKYWLVFFVFLPFNMAVALPPIAVSDERTTSVNFPITINVLNNDSDPDGDNFQVISATDPSNGTISINSDGGITYIPNTNFSGVDTFTYTIEDDGEVAESAVGTVTVTVENSVFSAEGASINEQSVADALAQACDLLNGITNSELSAGAIQLSQRCDFIREISVSDPTALADIVEQISPEETLALLDVSSSASEAQSRAISYHLYSAKQGVQQADQSGMIWNHSIPYASAGEDIQSRLNLFVSVQIKDSERDATIESTGYSVDSTGFMIGTDYALSRDTVLGLAIGTTDSSLEFDADSGEIDTDSTTLIGFARFNFDNFALDLQLGLDQSESDVSRSIEYLEGMDLISVQSDGQADGDQTFLVTNFEYTLSRRAWSFSPFVQLEYKTSTIDQYEESNLAGFDVEIDEQTSDEINFRGGIRGQYAKGTNWGVLLPDFSLEFISNINEDRDTVEGRFIFAPEETSSFFIQPDDVDSLFFRMGGGLSAIFQGGYTGFLNFEIVVGQEDFSSSKLNAGFRAEF